MADRRRDRLTSYPRLKRHKQESMSACALRQEEVCLKMAESMGPDWTPALRTPTVLKQVAGAWWEPNGTQAQNDEEAEAEEDVSWADQS